MAHPDSGELLAFLDGELTGKETESLRAHLNSCAECRTGADALQIASSESARALLLYDTESPFERTRARVLTRKRTNTGRRSWSLPKAASIALLLTGAAATALPGSPVRRWMAQGWQALSETSEPAPRPGPVPETTEGQGAPSPENVAPETGAGIPALAQGVEIRLHDLPSEAELRVVWTDGDEAWIYAGEGTRFNSTDGRLEAFGPPGAIRVEIPRNLGQVVLMLDGNLLLRKSVGGLEILGPIKERTPSEILFETRGSPNAGRS